MPGHMLVDDDEVFKSAKRNALDLPTWNPRSRWRLSTKWLLSRRWW